MIVGFSQFLASNRRISSFLTSDSDSACRNPPLAHLQTPGNLQNAVQSGLYCVLVSVWVVLVVVLVLLGVVLVVVLVLLGVVLVIVEVVASHYCY